MCITQHSLMTMEVSVAADGFHPTTNPEPTHIPLILTHYRASRSKSVTRRARIKQLRGGLQESEADGAWLDAEAVRLQANLDASLLRRSELSDAIMCARQ